MHYVATIQIATVVVRATRLHEAVVASVLNNTDWVHALCGSMHSLCTVNISTNKRRRLNCKTLTEIQPQCGL